MTPVTLPENRQSGRDDGRSRDRGRFSRAVLASGLFHAVVLGILIGLWVPGPPKEAPPPIPVTLAGPEGVAGARGGGQELRAASAPGNAHNASTAARQPIRNPPRQDESASSSVSAATQAKAAATRPSEAPSLAAVKPRPAVFPTIEPVPPPKPAPPQRAARTPLKPPVPAPIPSARQSLQPSPPPSEPSTAAPSPTAASANAPSSNAASSAPPGGSAAPSAGGSGQAAEGPGRSAAGNGSLQGPGDDYLDEVQRWVARFRRYPDEAIKKRQEGVVMIGFKFTRDGKVLDAWIEKSSGYPLLDKAALRMIHDASPLPKVPARYKGDTLTLVMPERFRIGLFDRLFN